MNKIWVIVRKEWSEVFKNRFVLGTVAFLPLVFTALPLAIMGATRSSGAMGAVSAGDMPGSFAQLCGAMTGAECGQYFLVSEFLLLFMMMPLAIPVTIASYSIVGEKTTRTLEPLLATPVESWQLLLAKSLSAMLPAIAATWISGAIFMGEVFLLSSPAVFAQVVTPGWLILLLLTAPVLTMTPVALTVMTSSRFNDPRTAAQVSSLIFIVLVLVFSLSGGNLVISPELSIIVTLFLAVLGVVLLWGATRVFRRENILTQWK